MRPASGYRRIGQEKFGFVVERGKSYLLDALVMLIDWAPIDGALGMISSATKGEPAWRPLLLLPERPWSGIG
ncbi:hypothetical protein CIT26_00285 [Mesorhizobium temperatum]|uniref:Uncharacterized protein n=1 Tax=Mesorhizobium temperatum TaxID=241416 RepID=A0A271LYL9_9HYPH|nr:hypothetical protein CIT26_00285 [Mesorhizobium temperatum]